jgi:hypothetical protein
MLAAPPLQSDTVVFAHSQATAAPKLTSISTYVTSCDRCPIVGTTRTGNAWRKRESVNAETHSGMLDRNRTPYPSQHVPSWIRLHSAGQRLERHTCLPREGVWTRLGPVRSVSERRRCVSEKAACKFIAIAGIPWLCYPPPACRYELDKCVRTWGCRPVLASDAIRNIRCACRLILASDAIRNIRCAITTPC